MLSNLFAILKDNEPKEPEKSFIIDARILGFDPTPTRIISVCDQKTGQIFVSKKEDWSDLPIGPKNRDRTVIITDAPESVKSWHMVFDPTKHLEEVINLYQLRKRANLVKLKTTLNNLNPERVLETRRIDKKGIQQEFDSTMLTNGHIAVLVSVWASSKISIMGGSGSDDEDDGFDPSLMPYSI